MEQKTRLGSQRFTPFPTPVQGYFGHSLGCLKPYSLAMPSSDTVHLIDMEDAINWWRQRAPSADGLSLSKPVRVLADVYALMIFNRCDEVDWDFLSPEAQEVWLDWYRSTPDAPCIAICSTSQGDAVCKGCGRTFEEVQHWTAMTPPAKRATWRRITRDGTAWRFNRYSERART